MPARRSYFQRVEKQLVLLSGLSATHPAIMKIPPNGVIGPRKRTLGHLGFNHHCEEANNKTHFSLSAANARIEPENMIDPPKIAGPANL